MRSPSERDREPVLQLRVPRPRYTFDSRRPVGYSGRSRRACAVRVIASYGIVCGRSNRDTISAIYYDARTRRYCIYTAIDVE
ncbi:hypothetical protein EVAR_92513_1 [Eumeta japonica]|uniref:Uncharacterized protein n=1 Tax=Eumeta variegata TaxID=151549 RepID=A0A4C1T907_EUMVA|nr:hypothetical protein EVAR_92513_1 [Eumeta japonica]